MVKHLLLSHSLYCALLSVSIIHWRKASGVPFHLTAALTARVHGHRPQGKRTSSLLGTPKGAPTLDAELHKLTLLFFLSTSPCSIAAAGRYISGCEQVAVHYSAVFPDSQLCVVNEIMHFSLGDACSELCIAEKS